jgi:ribosomal protein L11 methyltransferase
MPPTQRIVAILQRAILDDDFRARLFADKHRTVEEFDLTPDEMQAIDRLEPEHLESFVGGLIAHAVIPIRATKRFVVVTQGQRDQVSPPDLPILVGPEVVFGNGLHPSTKLCLRELERRVKLGMSVLDLGTGTGILAIGAAMLGASRVMAVDIVPEAAESARRNVAQNKVADRVEVQHGTLSDVLAAGYHADIVVGNLLAPIIIHMAEHGLADTLKPGGVLIVAGLTLKQRRHVERALWNAKLRVVRRQTETDWSMLVARQRRLLIF